MAEVSSAVGGAGSGDFWLHKLSHGALGCAVASAKGSDCGAGATGAVTAELIAELTGGMDKEAQVAFVKLLVTGTAAALGQDINTALDTGNNAYQNNYLAHKVDLNLAKAKKDCASGSAVACNAVEILDKMDPDKVLTEEDRENLKEYSDYNDDEFRKSRDECNAGKSCEKYNYLNVQQREEWGDEAPNNYNSGKTIFNKVPDLFSVYHFPESWVAAIFGTPTNSKYVDEATGQLEVIVNNKTKKTIPDAIKGPNGQFNQYGGSYNYYPGGFRSYLQHKEFDIDPFKESDSYVNK